MEGQPQKVQVGERSTDPLADTHASGASGPRPASGRPDPRVGTQLAHFRIDAPLGRGGMGTVYRGWDTALERPVAVKVLTLDHPQARERFLREARAMAKVRHPNVVPIHFVGQEGDTVFLSMDLVEGPSLDERLSAGPLPVDEALDVVDAVARALDEGRKNGLIHRDVKPSNVLCAQDGRVLLADFGLAKAVDEPSIDPSIDPQPGDPSPDDASPPVSGASPALTQQGAIVGTPAYMAPEQTRGPDIDHRADMYALGVTLYEMTTGQRPFSAPTAPALLRQQREEDPLPARTLNPALSPEVDGLIARLMQKEPALRFDDYVALRQAIDASRVRAAPSAGGFTRLAAELVDLIPTVIVAGLLDPFALPGVGWLPGVLVWAFCEARWGKTLGKRLFAMRVVTTHERPPRALRALLRNALKHWGLIALSLAGLIGDDLIRQSVILALGGAWLLGLALAFRRDKRAAHDHLSGTRVAYDLASAGA